MYKILIVDDEAIEREGLKITIRQAKEDVEIVGEAASGKEAVALSEKLDPDIILMDIKISGMSGIEAAEIIKKKDKNKVIIILSAYSDFEFAYDALKIGIEDYLLKPVRPEKLLDVLSSQIMEINDRRNNINVKERLLSEKIKTGDHQQAKELLDKILKEYYLLRPKYIGILREKSTELADIMLKAASKMEIKNDHIVSIEKCYSCKLINMEDYDAIKEYLDNILDTIFEEITNRNDHNMSNKVKEALDYIAENYNEWLSLQDVAKSMYLSPHYFSKLFKKEMGMTYVSYVTKYKIEKAKEALEKTDRPIVNIALDLGYDETSYFSKVFKKMEGVTPTQYRKDKSGNFSR